MTQAVTVYRWDDEGAPQVTDGKPNEYLEVFKKCLVDGYGNKQPLGWVVEDESLPDDTPFLSIKNNISEGGSGGVIMFSASNNNQRTAIRCQSVLDYISKTEHARTGPYFAISSGSTGTNSANKWIVIASAKAFYFIALPEHTLTRNSFGTYSHILFFAGDIKSFYGADSASFVTLSGKVNTMSMGWNGSLNYILGDATSSTVGQVYALDGALEKADIYVLSSFGNHSVNQPSIQDSSPDIRVLSSLLVCTGGYYLSGAGNYGNNESLPFARGEVPGLFVSQEYGFMNEKMPFIKLIDGVEYFSIPRANNGGSCAWICMEEWV